MLTVEERRDRMVANWAPLRARLFGIDTLTIGWDELNALVGGLPESATKHQAFWFGERSRWPAYRTADVVVGKSVTFVRFDGAPARRSPTRAVTATSAVATHPACSSGPADIVLVGCVKEKLDHPAAARDLYVSPLFAKERAYAEASGVPWFNLSAEHGLVAPDEVLAPYDLRLSKTSVDYRRAWGSRVVQRLGDVAGPLDGKRIEVHAGSAYIDPIKSLLAQHGASVVDPLAGLTFGPRLAWYKSGGALSPVPLAPANAETSQIAPDAAEYVRIDRPVIITTPRRSENVFHRFSTADEIGHLVLHGDAGKHSAAVDKEADEFTAAFLTPAAAMDAALPQRLDLAALDRLGRT